MLSLPRLAGALGGICTPSLVKAATQAFTSPSLSAAMCAARMWLIASTSAWELLCSCCLIQIFSRILDLFKPFCPDNVILARLSGRVVPCPFSMLEGRHDDENLISLTRPAVNTPPLQ